MAAPRVSRRQKLLQDAAPAMLTALKLAKQALEGPDHLFTLGVVNEAIAKAEGRS